LLQRSPARIRRIFRGSPRPGDFAKYSTVRAGDRQLLSPNTVFFSKTWTALLAAMATSFLAGMFLLAARASAPFSEADHAALRTVASAGIAALSADISTAPVTLAGSILREPRVDRSLRGTPKDGEPLNAVFITAANESLLASFPQLSVALLDEEGKVLSQTGLYEPLFDLLWKNEDFLSAKSDKLNRGFATVIDDRLFSVRIFPIAQSKVAGSLVALHPVDLGESSFLRRVLGVTYPAAVVRGNKVIGEPIGSLAPSVLLEIAEVGKDRVPATGASETIQIGAGVDQRLGALGRIAGPTSQHDHALYLVVSSANAAGFVEKDLVQVLREAAHEQPLAELNWTALSVLFGLSIALTLYLHFLEVNTPLRRLRAEFQAINKGTQHQIYFDIYPGMFGELARSAAELVDTLNNRGPRPPTQENPALPKKRTSTRQRTVGTGGHPTPASDRYEAVPEPHEAPAAIAASTRAPAPPPSTDDAPESNMDAVRMLDDAFFDPFDDDVPTLRNLGKPAESQRDEMPRERSGARTVMAFPALANANQREAQMQEIYQRFLETKQACGESTESTTFERFLAKVEQNRQALLAQPGVKDVQFSVYIKDGKAALKAKVVRV
jgi:hypothetical protein